MRTGVELRQGGSMHPTVRLTFPTSFLSTLSADLCFPAVLLRLPPTLFLDSNTFPAQGGAPFSTGEPTQVASVRLLNSTHPSLSSHDFTKVELEAGVGYSDPSGEQRRRAPRAQANPLDGQAARQVKRVSKDKFVVDSAGDDGHSRYQDVRGDALQPLAKEFRAVLIKLNKLKEGGEGEKEEDYDELTGVRPVRETRATTTLDIPIHTRYPSPVLTTPTWDVVWKGGSNYESVSLDRPELLWMCSEVEYMLEERQFEKIEASELLPSPHSHLSLPLDGSPWHSYRYRLPSQHTPFQLQVPTGDASLGPLVQLITFASLFIAAIWTALRVQAALSKVQKVEGEWEKRQLGKAE